MSTRGEPEAQGSVVRPDSSSRFKRWAARRGRQLLLVFLGLSCVLVLLAASALLRRGTCLIGLPDVGDPFDVSTVYAERIPDDRNAFAYYRKALAKLQPHPNAPLAMLDAVKAVEWSKADPRIRALIESNHEALDLFRRGAEQADAWAHPAKGETAFYYERMHLHPFVKMIFLEASRLEELGDMAGAWVWYRTFLRMRAHVMRRGTAFERYFANQNGSELLRRAGHWAADPKTQVIDLRGALEDVIAFEPKPEWEASALKVDYLLAMRELEHPGAVLSSGYTEERKYEIGGEPLPPNLAQTVHAIRRFLIREPERSRRILRLAFANWLAHIEIPEERHRKPAVRALLENKSVNPGVYFYAAGPAAPASARALALQDLAEWLLTAPDARMLQGQWLWPSIGTQERRQHRALLILLAEELYHREHGQPPSSENDLVGTYLKHLPDDGSADLADGTMSIVEDSQNNRSERMP